MYMAFRFPHPLATEPKAVCELAMQPAQQSNVIKQEILQERADRQHAEQVERETFKMFGELRTFMADDAKRRAPVQARAQKGWNTLKKAIAGDAKRQTPAEIHARERYTVLKEDEKERRNLKPKGDDRGQQTAEVLATAEAERKISEDDADTDGVTHTVKSVEDELKSSAVS